MTEPQKAKFLWLCNAMTAPEYAAERYYYDGINEIFFYTKELNELNVAFYSFLGFPLSEREYSDIAVRMEFIDDDSSQLVEIPRLNVSNKINIQLDFLSHFDGVYHLQDLVIAVENQKDAYKMALDTVLIENSNSAPMVKYWDAFKLTAVYNFLNGFANAVGIEINID